MATLIERLQLLTKERQAQATEKTRIDNATDQIGQALRAELAVLGLSRTTLERMTFDVLTEVAMVLLEPRWLPLRAEDLEFLRQMVRTSTATQDRVERAVTLLESIRPYVPDARRHSVLEVQQTQAMPPPPTSARPPTDLSLDYIE